MCGVAVVREVVDHLDGFVVDEAHCLKFGKELEVDIGAHVAVPPVFEEGAAAVDDTEVDMHLAGEILEGGHCRFGEITRIVADEDGSAAHGHDEEQ